MNNKQPPQPLRTSRLNPKLLNKKPKTKNNKPKTTNQKPKTTNKKTLSESKTQKGFKKNSRIHRHPTHNFFKKNLRICGNSPTTIFLIFSIFQSFQFSFNLPHLHRKSHIILMRSIQRQSRKRNQFRARFQRLNGVSVAFR